ncbi:hypothetical protein BD410DRAFT_794644 [Rickenella mellea]|uniref:Uncharacterized protein n=1 Tax=Rickenella mellea TaxID=50990 RepID=A0A4Y7PPW6_9AGAM|nr:hypothetical protein BD410DRAFT_794644 [Rickenella mellea]
MEAVPKQNGGVPEVDKSVETDLPTVAECMAQVLMSIHEERKQVEEVREGLEQEIKEGKKEREKLQNEVEELRDQLRVVHLQTLLNRARVKLVNTLGHGSWQTFTEKYPRDAVRFLHTRKDSMAALRDPALRRILQDKSLLQFIVVGKIPRQGMDFRQPDNDDSLREVINNSIHCV